MDSSLTSPSAEIEGSPAPISPRRSRRRPLVVVGLLAVALLFGGCKVPSFGFYPGATKQGQTTFHLWQQFFIAGLVVGGLVLILILWAIFRYRRKSDAIPKQTQYHTVLEIAYTVVPILIVIGLFVITVFAENEVTAVTPNPAVTIHVNAFQWGWEFSYSGGPNSGCVDPGKSTAIQSQCVKIIGQTTQAPTMVMPAGQTVRIELDSLDVLHGFYVPQFNFSRYASPGYQTDFDFDVLHPGVYRGQCTQLCGLYHSLMFFNVRAVSPSQYAVWLRAQQALVQAHPGAGPQLPSGVKAGSSSSNITTSGSDDFGD